MRKLFILAMAVLLCCRFALAQSISPFVLNSTGGSFKVNNKNFYLDWSVAEMTLITTVKNSGYSGLFIITNGFLQPDKNEDDKDEDDDHYYDKYVNPDYTIKNIQVYPNPASTYVTIDIPVEEAGKVQLTLYNSMGQLVYKKEITTYGHHTKERISMGAFMQGTYLLRVRMGPPGIRAKEMTYKIVKAN